MVIKTDTYGLSLSYKPEDFNVADAKAEIRKAFKNHSHDLINDLFGNDEWIDKHIEYAITDHDDSVAIEGRMTFGIGIETPQSKR